MKYYRALIVITCLLLIVSSAANITSFYIGWQDRREAEEQVALRKAELMDQQIKDFMDRIEQAKRENPQVGIREYQCSTVRKDIKANQDHQVAIEPLVSLAKFCLNNQLLPEADALVLKQQGLL